MKLQQGKFFDKQNENYMGLLLDMIYSIHYYTCTLLMKDKIDNSANCNNTVSLLDKLNDKFYFHQNKNLQQDMTSNIPRYNYTAHHKDSSPHSLFYKDKVPVKFLSKTHNKLSRINMECCLGNMVDS